MNGMTAEHINDNQREKPLELVKSIIVLNKHPQILKLEIFGQTTNKL